VNSLSSAKKISKEILNTKNKEVSYNTIRIFFGLFASKQKNYCTKTAINMPRTF
jgi:hypothetical protein